jgi:hypothetical protein
MNTHIEKENILVIGRKEIDVSNVSVGKSLKGLGLYNEQVVKLQNEEITALDFDKEVDKIGLMLIKQDYEALRLRYNPIKSIVEMFKKRAIKEKHIYSMSREDYKNVWQDWVYFAITGDKKKDLETTANIMETTKLIYQKMQTEMSLNPEQCSELLMTLLKDQMKELKASTIDLKES